MPRASFTAGPSHLDVLKAAHLVATVKVGREKRHYLNAIPLQEVQARWLTPFATQQAQGLLDFRTRLEQEPMTTDQLAADPAVTAPDTVFTIFIRASRDRVWEALTDASGPRPWLYDTVTHSEWAPGSPYT